MMDGTKMERKRVGMVRRTAEMVRATGGIASGVVEEASERAQATQAVWERLPGLLSGRG